MPHKLSKKYTRNSIRFLVNELHSEKGAVLITAPFSGLSSLTLSMVDVYVSNVDPAYHVSDDRYPY